MKFFLHNTFTYYTTQNSHILIIQKFRHKLQFNAANDSANRSVILSAAAIRSVNLLIIIIIIITLKTFHMTSLLFSSRIFLQVLESFKELIEIQMKLHSH